MASSIKKTNVAITGMLTAVTSLCADTNSTCPPELCLSKPCTPKQQECTPPTCNPSQYFGPNCIPAPYCAEVNIKGELLYWKAELCGLETAFGNTSIATVVGPGTFVTTTIQESDLQPDFSWRPGFRVGADFAFNCFELEADWTHYNGRAHFKKNGQHGNWRIRYDTIDLIFGRRCSVAPCFYFKPFIGVRGLRVHQTLKSDLNTLFIGATSVIGNTTVTTTKNDKEHFWGLGAEFGVEADWYLGCDFTVYGSFDVVTYYGSVHGRYLQTDTFPVTANVSNARSHHCFDNIGTDAAIGIRWDKAWHRCNYDVLFMLDAGLEQHRIYEFSNIASDGTLSLDGGVFAVGIGLRY
jgi:hypothetical protein